MLRELARGLGTTLKMMFERPVTVQYPEEKRPVRPRFRGRRFAGAQTGDDSRQRQADRPQGKVFTLGVSHDALLVLSPSNPPRPRLKRPEHCLPS